MQIELSGLHATLRTAEPLAITEMKFAEPKIDAYRIWFQLEVSFVSAIRNNSKCSVTKVLYYKTKRLIWTHEIDLWIYFTVYAVNMFTEISYRDVRHGLQYAFLFFRLVAHSTLSIQSI